MMRHRSEDAAPAERPNVILIVLDTARQDALQPYNRGAGTPACQQLASEGSYHRDLFAPACWTVPSHASLFLGDLPRSIGFDHRGGQSRQGYQATMRARADAVLPAVLRSHGYETRAVSTNPWVNPGTGFDTGFDHFAFRRSPRWSHRGEGGPRQRLKWYLQAVHGNVDDGARSVMAEVERWLAQRSGKPFFWFVNLIECHSPYLPPRANSPFGPIGRVRVADEARRYLRIATVARQNLAFDVVPGKAIDRMRRQYEGAVAYMDGWIAHLRDRLARSGLADDTVIIVTSDHGENFGEGGRLGHAFALNDALVRLPFVWAGPVSLDLPPIASLAHVPAALCHALGIEHPWPTVPGAGEVTVAQFDAPFRADALHVDDPALAQVGLDDDPALIERACTSFVIATDGTRKLLRSGDREQLIDTLADPAEVAPVAVPPGSTDPGVAPLRAAIDAATAAEVPRQNASDAVAAATSETEALEDQLRLLGYM